MRSRTDALSACVWGMCSRRGGRGAILQIVKRRLSEAGDAVEGGPEAAIDAAGELIVDPRGDAPAADDGGGGGRSMG